MNCGLKNGLHFLLETERDTVPSKMISICVFAVFLKLSENNKWADLWKYQKRAYLWKEQKISITSAEDEHKREIISR